MTVVAVVVAYLIAPVLSDFIVENTSLDNTIGDKVYVVVKEITKERLKEELGSVLTDVDEAVLDDLAEVAMEVEPTQNTQVKIIQQMKLPGFMTDALISNNNKEMRSELGADGFYMYLAYYISYMLVKVISFVAVFIVLCVAVNIIYFALGIVSKLPIVGSVDKMGGILFGALEALLVVWIVFLVISLLANTEIGGNLFNQIEENKVLKMIYDKNVLYSLVTKLGK